MTTTADYLRALPIAELHAITLDRIHVLQRLIDTTLTPTELLGDLVDEARREQDRRIYELRQRADQLRDLSR